MKYVTKTFKVELVSEDWDVGQPLRSPEDAFHFAEAIYAPLDADKEHFVVIVVNSKHRVQGFKVISTGTLTASLVSPREVFTAVLSPDWRAAAIILVHNHPSGEPTPSPEDIDITRRLREIADVLGIKIQDHIVLGHGRYFSFLDRGML